MAYPYTLTFTQPGFVHPKTETGKPGTRWAEGNPLSYTSRIVGGVGGRGQTATDRYKIYLVYSVKKNYEFPYPAYLYAKTFNSIAERDLWRAELEADLYRGKIFGHENRTALTGFVSTSRVDRSSGLWLEAGEAQIPTEYEIRKSAYTGAVYGVGVIIANNEQASNIMTYQMSVSYQQQADPSTSSGYRTNTLKYGQPQPEPQVEKDCSMFCNIVYIPTNTVAYSGFCSCSMIEDYQNDPDYRIDQISKGETKPDYRGTQPEPDKLYTVHGQTIPLSQTAVDYYRDLGVAVTTAHIDPYVAPTEKPFEKPPRVSVFQPVEPEITTSQVEPPVEAEPQVTTSQVEPQEEAEPQVTTSQVEPPEFHDISSAEEESRQYELWEQQVTTSQVEPQEVTARISWFGDTWFPYHFNFENELKRRR